MKIKSLKLYLHKFKLRVEIQKMVKNFCHSNLIQIFLQMIDMSKKNYVNLYEIRNTKILSLSNHSLHFTLVEIINVFLKDTLSILIHLRFLIFKILQ